MISADAQPTSAVSDAYYAWPRSQRPIERPIKYSGGPGAQIQDTKFSYYGGEDVTLKVHANGDRFHIEVVRDGINAHMVLSQREVPGNRCDTLSGAYGGFNPRKAYFDNLGHTLQQGLEASAHRSTTALERPVLSNRAVPHSRTTLRQSIARLATRITTRQIFNYSHMNSHYCLRATTPQTISSADEPSESASERDLVATLLSHHSRVSHMVLTDSSYKVFVSMNGNGALCYKFHKSIAVVCGDPLCQPQLYGLLLEEFQVAHQLSTRQIVFLGMSDTFAQSVQTERWLTFSFGVERFVNPLTNPILEGKSSKRIYTQMRQLLDPRKAGLHLEIYDPTRRQHSDLDKQMADVYEHWRLSRDQHAKPQSYLTLLDLGCYPGEIFYLLVKDSKDKVQGFAGLRRLGGDRGYHLDPCIEAVHGPRGIADLLTIASMALLRTMNIGAMSLGYEPSTELHDAIGYAKGPGRVLRPLYHHFNRILHLEGKRKHHDRFKPDDSQNANLFLIFPATRLPRLSQFLAVTTTVHLDAQHVLKEEIKRWKAAKRDPN